jgi:hypothetical protein
VAFRDQIDSASFPRMFYNVSEAVGPGARNRRDDVLLVQFLLKRYYTYFGACRPAGELAVDGHFGPTTHRWIRAFQQELNGGSDRGSVYANGVVARAQSEHGELSRKYYTILFLNAFVRLNEPTTFEALPDDPEMPPDLAAALGG